jgi:hypothetical protein
LVAVDFRVAVFAVVFAAVLVADFVAVFFTAVFFTAVLRVVAFFAGAFFAVRLTGPRARLSASSSYPRSAEICSGSSSLRQGRVGLAVGDVRAEPAVLDDDRPPRHGVVAELGQRRLGRGPPALLGLRVDRERLLEGDVEQLLLGLE